jgi:cell division septal protein FtsQ
VASTFVPAAKDRAALFPQPVAFQRGSGRADVRRQVRRFALRPKHVVGLFLAALGFFIGLHRLSLFLLTWDELEIRTVTVACGKPELRETLERACGERRLGNLLVCDVERVRGWLREFAGVKDARVRKAFPSALRIEVVPRAPYAYLQKDGLWLIDREGVALEPAPAGPILDRPLLKDAGDFREGLAEKLALAAACLDSLPAETRALVEWLDLSDAQALTLGLRDDPVRLVLAASDVREEMLTYLERKAEWEERFGPLNSVDLRLAARGLITIEPLQPAQDPGTAASPAGSPKEAL